MGSSPEQSIQRVLDIVKEKVVARELPDTCTITRPSGTPTISDAGNISWSGGTELVSYQGSTSIPCRFEISRSFRPESTEWQEIVVSEFTLYLPVDVPMQTGYVIKLVDQHAITRWFEPRKISNISAWDVIMEVTVEELMPQQEPA